MARVERGALPRPKARRGRCSTWAPWRTSTFNPWADQTPRRSLPPADGPRPRVAVSVRLRGGVGGGDRGGGPRERQGQAARPQI